MLFQTSDFLYSIKQKKMFEKWPYNESQWGPMLSGSVIKNPINIFHRELIFSDNL